MALFILAVTLGFLKTGHSQDIIGALNDYPDTHNHDEARIPFQVSPRVWNPTQVDSIILANMNEYHIPGLVAMSMSTDAAT